MTFKEIKESLYLNKDNNKILINENFINIDKIDLCNNIDNAYSICTNLIMDTLRFLGRPNDGLEIEWDHTHKH